MVGFRVPELLIVGIDRLPMGVVKSSSSEVFKKTTQIWFLRTWLSGGPRSARLMVGLCDLRSLFQP